jgi:hypothetical protein
MPPHYDLAQQPGADNWMLLEAVEAPALDTMIRHAGWPFMCLQEACSRSGVGLSRDEAIHQALVRALKGLKVRFNAAELESVQVSSYRVFHKSYPATSSNSGKYFTRNGRRRRCSSCTGEMTPDTRSLSANESRI